MSQQHTITGAGTAKVGRTWCREAAAKRLSEACRHLKVFHKVHQRRVWNYPIFDEPHSHVKVEYPWILA